MRRDTSTNQQHCSACYGAGTRVEVHRSRYELERVLNKFGADEVFFVEADANASIQFAMHGHYVQLALPLPDPENSRFTHTPSGKRRTVAAQERAYEQALREHWRSLVVVVRGKLQSVETGISTFEHEFDKFLVPNFADEKKRSRKTPKAVNWLLGGSHSLAIALVAAFLVPASAVGAFALPTNVVGRLATPFRSSVRDDVTAGGSGPNGLVLARGGWAPSNGGGSRSDVGRLLALRASNLMGTADGQLRDTANLSSPPFDVPASPSARAAAETSPPPRGGAPQGDSAPGAPAGGGKGPASNGGGNASAPADDSPSTTTPADTGGDSQASDSGLSAPSSDDASAEQPSTDGAPVTDPASQEPAAGAPGNTGGDTPSDPAPGNGNGNGNGQANGQGNGNGNGQANGQGNGKANGQGNGQANGNNGNGQADGQGNGNNGNGNGQADGQGNGQGQGSGQQNGQGKVKGGK